MKLSIVMVNWNRFDDLSYSIDKIGSLNSDWEFVIVDNGSGHDVNSNPYEIYENRKTSM